jgi:hypothetical protein
MTEAQKIRRKKMRKYYYKKIKLQKLKRMPLKYRQEINDIYKECNLLNRIFGNIYSVDHIHPLRGETSWGLHVPWNLRIITKKENYEKGNKLIELKEAA